MKLETTYKSTIIYHCRTPSNRPLHQFIKDYEDVVLVVDEHVNHDWHELLDFIT